MPIGKDSITKRVAKAPNVSEKETAPIQNEKNIAPELVATSAAAPKVKKTTSTAKKSSQNTKKTTTKKTVKIETSVLGNVSPDTIKAVTGHEENKGFEKTQLGEKMPVHLL